MLYTGPNQSAQYSGLGVEGVVVDAAGGAPFNTIGQAIAYFAAHNAAGRRVIYVMPGAYAESFTVPAAPFSIIGLGQVEITGTVTLTDDADEYLLENLQITSAAAGTCIDADMGGLAATGTVRLRNIRLVTSAVGVGLLASACNVFIEGGLRVSCPGSIGIDLTAGDVAAEVTRLLADRVQIQGAAVTTGIRTAGGAGAAAVDVVRVEIADLYLEGSAASVGCIENSGGTVAEGLPSGFEIGTMHCIPAAAGAFNTFFRSSNAAAANRIGRITGTVVSDILIDNDAGQTTVGYVDLPGDGVARDTFQVAVVTAGTVNILGGFAAGGTAAMFQSLAGAGSLRVQNFTIPSLAAGGQWYVAADCTGTVQFEFCSFAGNTAAAKMAIDGGAAGAGTFTLRHCTLDATGAAAAIAVLDADFQIEYLRLRQVTAGQHAITILDPTGAPETTSFTWRGHNEVSVAAGAGFALNVAAVTLGTIALRESGILDFGNTPVVDQHAIAAAAGGTRTLTTIGDRQVVQGSLQTNAVADVGGDAVDGVPSVYPGLHFVAAIHRTITGGGAGDDSLTARLTNLTSAVAAVTTAFVDTGAALRVHERGATSAVLPVGPGQELRLDISVSGAAGTDLVLSAA